jgi:NADH:ubiquinone oxidoreductase subunit C
MENEKLRQLISSWEPSVELIDGPQYLEVVVPSAQFRALAEKLRFDNQTQFDYMFNMTCVDWNDHFQTIYHLESTKLNHALVLKAKIADHNQPEVDTICDIWRTAELHEREVFDLFGVKFNQHPDLRRLLLTDEWVGHPLRKDYVDEVNMVLR